MQRLSDDILAVSRLDLADFVHILLNSSILIDGFINFEMFKMATVPNPHIETLILNLNIVKLAFFLLFY